MIKPDSKDLILVVGVLLIVGSLYFIGGIPAANLGLGIVLTTLAIAAAR
jgi:hypothetical protein